MRNESIAIIESSSPSSSNYSSHNDIKDTISNHHRSVVVTPSPTSTKNKKKSVMMGSPTKSSPSPSPSSRGGEDVHPSKDPQPLVTTDDDTTSSNYDDDDDTDCDHADNNLNDDEEEEVSLDPVHNFNYHIVDTTNTTTAMDEKQLYFPPNYHPSRASSTNNNKHPTNTITGNNNNKSNNIPSYFLCPITNQIMIDPVIDHEGNTYERHAILRWLVVYPNISPITGNQLCMEELQVDKLVKSAIEKARRDAWVRYILELETEEESGGEGGDKLKNKKKGEVEKNGSSITKIEGKGKQRTSSEPKQQINSHNDNNKVVVVEKKKKKKKKSDLENYLDRKSGGGGSSLSGSKYSATSESKHSGGSSSSGGNSQEKKKKKETQAVVVSSVSPSAVGVVVAGGSPSPSTSSKKVKQQQQEQQQQQGLRSKTPPPTKILLPKRNTSSTKSTKSNSSSVASSSKEKKKQQQKQQQQQPPQAQAHQQQLASSEISPRTTKPISSITVPKKTTTTTTSTSSSSSALFPPPPVISSNTSITSAISFSGTGIEKLHNGWSVPLGVHKLICSSPGLLVTTDVHRRSTPVKRTIRDINNNCIQKELIIAPGSYVEILETQVHGGRVRGRIVWEEEDLESNGKDGGRLRRKKKKKKKKKKSLLEKRPKRKSKMFQRGRAKNKKENDDGTQHEDDDDNNNDSVSEENMVRYSGWISVQWAEEEDVDNVLDGNVVSHGRLVGGGGSSDEDAGPWTEPIPLGVYRISFGAGLPLRETPERDSAVLDKLERGRCVEVVETTVKGDRVRARCLVPPLPQQQEGDDNLPGKKQPARFQSGWISLLNALTGASGASPVPLGAYVAVAEGGCVVTEGGRLDSKEKGTLNPGSCIEVVATRIEEGTVRGLIAAGGHVTLFVLNGASSSTNRLAAVGGTKNPDGGRMFAMPVPLGTYQVVQNGLSVTSGLSLNSPVSMKLKVNACAEIAETRVEGGRVRGRLTAVGYGGVAKEVNGWISLFEPTQRWAKIVCFKGGRPISPQQQQQQQEQAQA